MSPFKKALLTLVAFSLGLAAWFTTVSAQTTSSGGGAASKAQHITRGLTARGVTTRAFRTATNGFLTIQVDEATGQFTVMTGAQHPVPNEDVLFPIGTSYITLRDVEAQKMVCNDAVFSAGLAGYSTALLYNEQTTTAPLGPTGFRTTYTIPNWQVVQDVIINGDSLANSNVQHSVTVTNTGAADRQMGLRYMWDWKIANADESLFRPRQPDGTFTSTFATFNDPAFKLYEEVDRATNPTFSIFGSVRDLPLSPAPTKPDQVRYCSWSASVGSAWDFANTGGNTDSSVCYYWGMATPVTIGANQAKTFTQYLTTQLSALAPSLNITKSAPASVTSGNNLVYTFTVTNPGSATARGIIVSDTLPTGTRYVTATGGLNPTFNSTTGVFTMGIPDIAPGQRRTATLTVKVTATSGNVVNQTYSVRATGVLAVSGTPVTTAVTGGVAPTPTPRPFPTPGPLVGRVAFMSTRIGNNEIYRMNADGSAQTRVTVNTVPDETPHFDRPGNRIVFSSLRGGNRDIYLINTDGTGERRLTTNVYADSEPQFSADGSKIAFVAARDGNAEIYVMNADGSGQTRVTRNTYVDSHPSFSPDGTKLIFSSKRGVSENVFVINTNGTGEKQLTFSAGIDAKPTWSPDGERIAFQSNRLNGQYDIYVMNADGSGQSRVTYNTAIDTLPCFSPDSTRIAFVSTRNGGDNDILSTGLAGELVVPITTLTNNTFGDTMPSWAPPADSGAQGIAGRAVHAKPSKVTLSSAELSGDSIELNFDGALDKNSVSAARFSVEVDGEEFAVQSATLSGDSSVSLALAKGALDQAQKVVVTWQNLRDKTGAALSGDATLE